MIKNSGVYTDVNSASISSDVSGLGDKNPRLITRRDFNVRAAVATASLLLAGCTVGNLNPNNEGDVVDPTNRILVTDRVDFLPHSQFQILTKAGLYDRYAELVAMGISGAELDKLIKFAERVDLELQNSGITVLGASRYGDDNYPFYSLDAYTLYPAEKRIAPTGDGLRRLHVDRKAPGAPWNIWDYDPSVRKNPSMWNRLLGRQMPAKQPIPFTYHFNELSGDDWRQSSVYEVYGFEKDIHGQMPNGLFPGVVCNPYPRYDVPYKNGFPENDFVLFQADQGVNTRIIRLHGDTVSYSPIPGQFIKYGPFAGIAESAALAIAMYTTDNQYGLGTDPLASSREYAKYRHQYDNLSWRYDALYELLLGVEFCKQHRQKRINATR